ncbi:uncharacterized protein ARMOST_18277 [Armillaria ostoyae]|uniref:Uncharacterized protein n=1 Tax=Armillaria ostoyae TaxID=47428 RepID=A0A284S1F5_ARMOS|nr:uncharacterized protein ARMOST_18277 [Armillaria ostoyae]
MFAAEKATAGPFSALAKLLRASGVALKRVSIVFSCVLLDIYDHDECCRSVDWTNVAHHVSTRYYAA